MTGGPPDLAEAERWDARLADQLIQGGLLGAVGQWVFRASTWALLDAAVLAVEESEILGQPKVKPGRQALRRQALRKQARGGCGRSAPGTVMCVGGFG